jgi:hypothetical protein
MSETTAQEPTMEEILASIRRIISEDEAPAGAGADAAPASLHAVEASAAFPEAEDEEVLELDQPYQAEFEAPAEPVDASAAFGDIEAHPAPAPEPVHHAESFASFEAPQPRLVDEVTAQSVASAFANLGANIAMPRDGRTLEDLVKELMYPLLREWLNQNLPHIVEAEVRAEVDRLSRLRGAR